MIWKESFEKGDIPCLKLGNKVSYFEINIYVVGSKIE